MPPARTKAELQSQKAKVRTIKDRALAQLGGRAAGVVVRKSLTNSR